jgi:alpha-D-ribose 1-methylphosphonate 5-triphosphate synthase subunit PhnG
MMMTETDPGKTTARETTARQSWMAILARASRGEIETLAGAALPPHEILKAPETGTVMVEGRAGGAGRRFNLGEATVTRCVVRLENGAMGFSYALGRDGRKARLAAILDARLQSDDADGALLAGVTLLAATQAAARDHASRKAAATKVDFFTLVRGA